MPSPLKKTPKNNCKEEASWSLTITNKKSLFSLELGAIWRYRDLLLILVRRDFVALYKQTILGPLWFLVQPVLTTLVFTIMFGGVAGMTTDGIPKPLFFISGTILWNYFAETTRTSSETFIQNQQLFNKVYFPRIIIPIAIAISSLLKLSIQLCIFVALYVYYLFAGEEIVPNYYLFLLPVYLFTLGLLALGIGTLISSLTVKYRDIRFMTQFGLQLLMYMTPGIIFSVTVLKSYLPDNYGWLPWINPLAGVIENFKFSVLSKGNLNLEMLAYSFFISLVVFAVGVGLFQRTEKTFIDTV